jgi:hypothetical protein
MENRIDIKDLEFVKDLNEDLAEMIYDICILNISDMKSALDSPENKDDAYIKGLEPNKLEEMISFYDSMLDAFIHQEKYEYCGDIKYVVESLEKYKK